MRKKVVAESSDEETSPGKSKDESEDDFVTPPKRSPRKQTQSRRKTTDFASDAILSSHGRRQRKSNENPELQDPEKSTETVPESPSKRISPRKRKSVSTKAPRISPAPSLSPHLPTPKPSLSPEPPELHASPLADITESLNEQPRTAEPQTPVTKPVEPLDATLEKPADIVLKSRPMTAAVVEPAGPKPRIVITYLILTNFKSYAGRQEVGPFHASFSAVVGPNGSGKSNVIDSLLFVFGFRASKMRQGKISALIHNSAAYPDLDYCEVAVHFQEIMDRVS